MSDRCSVVVLEWASIGVQFMVELGVEERRREQREMLSQLAWRGVRQLLIDSRFGRDGGKSKQCQASRCHCCCQSHHCHSYRHCLCRCCCLCCHCRRCHCCHCCCYCCRCCCCCCYCLRHHHCHCLLPSLLPCLGPTTASISASRHIASLISSEHDKKLSPHRTLEGVQWTLRQLWKHSNAGMPFRQVPLKSMTKPEHYLSKPSTWEHVGTSESASTSCPLLKNDGELGRSHLHGNQLLLCCLTNCHCRCCCCRHHHCHCCGFCCCHHPLRCCCCIVAVTVTIAITVT